MSSFARAAWMPAFSKTSKRRTISFPPWITATSRSGLLQLQDLLEFRLPLARDGLYIPLVVHLDGHGLMEVEVRRHSPIGSLERFGVTSVGPDRHGDIADVLSHNVNDMPLDGSGDSQRRQCEQAYKSNDGDNCG